MLYDVEWDERELIFLQSEGRPAAKGLDRVGKKSTGRTLVNGQADIL